MDTLQLRRTVRLLLWFCVGLLVSGYSVAVKVAAVVLLITAESAVGVVVRVVKKMKG